MVSCWLSHKKGFHKARVIVFGGATKQTTPSLLLLHFLVVVAHFMLALVFPMRFAWNVIYGHHDSVTGWRRCQWNERLLLLLLFNNSCCDMHNNIAVRRVEIERKGCINFTWCLPFVELRLRLNVDEETLIILHSLIVVLIMCDKFELGVRRRCDLYFTWWALILTSKKHLPSC